jgi:uroporphyrinogen-III synthase
MTAEASPLTGMHILITRPLAQAQQNAAALKRLGARVSAIPLLDILPFGNAHDFAVSLQNIPRDSLFVFVSGNAVRHGLAALAQQGYAASSLTAAAVGTATRDALLAAEVPTVYAPTEGFDSEALLATLKSVEVQDRCTVIVRGTGEEPGRSLLGDSLAARGADVRYLECYRRVLPPASASALTQLFDAGPIDAISLMSVETVKHLFHVTDARHYARLTQTLLAVPHARVAAAARALGAQNVMVMGIGAASLESMLALSQARSHA